MYSKGPFTLTESESLVLGVNATEQQILSFEVTSFWLSVSGG